MRGSYAAYLLPPPTLPADAPCWIELVYILGLVGRGGNVLEHLGVCLPAVLRVVHPDLLWNIKFLGVARVDGGEVFVFVVVRWEACMQQKPTTIVVYCCDVK